MLAFLAGGVCLLVVGGTSFFTLRDVSSKYDHVVKVNFENAILLASMRGMTKDTRGMVYRLGLPKSTAEELNSVRNNIAEALKKYENVDKKYKGLGFVPGEERIYNAQVEKWKLFIESVNKLIELSKRTEAERVTLYTGLGEFDSRADAYLASLQELIEFQSTETVKWSKMADQAASSGTLISIVFVLGGFGFSLVIGFLFSGLLVKQLSLLSTQMLDSANSVAGTSKQVSSAGTELSSSTTEQAAALQQTVSSIEQVSAMVSKNAENSKRSLDVSKVSQESVMKGKEVIGSMIQSIEEISRGNADITQQMENSNQQVSEILKVISEIGSKTKIINDIVFQTKLLSFNASVEAARAGEHGKGFAVVAEEVGNLAQMSGNAAKEISQMLDGSIKKVDTIVTETRSRVEKLIAFGKDRVENGTNTAKRCGEVLDEIVREVTQVTQMVNEISTASHEQAQGVQEINKAMTQMDQVTQQNATASQQVAGASEQLSAQAETLRSLVDGLRVTIQGTNGVSSVPVEKTAPVRTQLDDRKVVALKAKSSTKPSAKKPVPEQSLGSVVRTTKFSKGGSALAKLPAQDDPRFEDV